MILNMNTLICLFVLIVLQQKTGGEKKIEHIDGKHFLLMKMVK